MTGLQISANIAEIATPIIAAIGLLFILHQIRASTRDANRVSAFESHRKLLEAAIAYPSFITPNPDRIDTENRKFDGDCDTFNQYEAFVDLMLSAFEEILVSVDQKDCDDYYREYMIEYISNHGKYISSKYFKKSFGDYLILQIKELLNRSAEKGNWREKFSYEPFPEHRA